MGDLAKIPRRYVDRTYVFACSVGSVTIRGNGRLFPRACDLFGTKIRKRAGSGNETVTMGVRAKKQAVFV